MQSTKQYPCCWQALPQHTVGSSTQLVYYSALHPNDSYKMLYKLAILCHQTTAYTCMNFTSTYPNVVQQDPRTKLWDTCGIVTHVGPHCQYHIHTQKDTKLIRNHQFIHRRIMILEPQRCSKAEPTLQAPMHQSQWTKGAPKRLIASFIN